MRTRLIAIDPLNPAPEILEEAAALIRAGELVAFPTETVYGLGADALNVNAARKIYEAKGRPSTNPIIVHVSGKEQAQSLVTTWTDEAEKLAEAFWPGPLTIVLPKKEHIPDIVTGNGSTVALRCPDDETALMLIESSGVPIAAPSANLSGRVSPVEADHVLEDFENKIPLILDAGPVPGGIESTVIDLSGDHPRLLRPGLLNVTEIENVIGSVERTPMITTSESPAPSPGLQHRHYAPRTKMMEGNFKDYQKYAIQGKSVYYMTFSNQFFEQYDSRIRALPLDPKQCARVLYSTMRALDDEQADLIIFDMPPQEDRWLGVRDRLVRASAQ